MTLQTLPGAYQFPSLPSYPWSRRHHSAVSRRGCGIGLPEPVPGTAARQEHADSSVAEPVQGKLRIHEDTFFPKE